MLISELPSGHNVKISWNGTRDLHFTHFLVILMYIKVREVIRVVNRGSDIVSCQVMRSAVKWDNLGRVWEPRGGASTSDWTGAYRE